MAGHSKWATTKRHKAIVDTKRGKLFSLIGKEITIAVRIGGSNPEFNVRLRALILKAKAANMPTENIAKAIKKGTGEIPGINIEELTYEGYAAGGVSLIVEVTTDNRNRSASEVRSLFHKYQGKLASTGSLSHSFQRRGQLLVERVDCPDENLFIEIALEAGAEDVLSHADHFEIICMVNECDAVAQFLAEKKILIESLELIYIPRSTISVTDLETRKRVQRLIDELDSLEDVKSIWKNLSAG